MKRNEKIKKSAVIMMLMVMLLSAIPFCASAASTVPVITSPTEKQLYLFRPSVTVKWTAPTSGTVSNYIISVRELNASSVQTNRLIVNSVSLSASTKSYTLSSSILKNNAVYRISVCAVLTTGSKKWSDERYFCTSIHTGQGLRPISFKIWTGFTTATKDAIYYSARAWNNATGYGDITEIVNTYAYSQGVSFNDVRNGDGINAVTGVSKGTEDPIMTTYSTYNASTGNLLEVDININKSKPWANSAQSGKYDVQNVMTHEMGHAVGLPDFYESFASEWTMYGNSNTNETKKRSLEDWDITLLREIYHVD